MADKNKVKFGLRNVHYAPLTVGPDGAIGWGTIMPWPGAVNLSLPPQGESNTFYADDVAYYVTVANNGYQGDFESALVPEDFEQNILGNTLDTTDKVLLENSLVESKPFALLFEFTGDQHGIKHVLYNCTAGRPSVASSTTSNQKTPITTSIQITVAPLADGKVKAKSTAATTQSVLDNWYKKVWVPTVPGVGG